MEYVSCKLSKDVDGFYLTPLIGYSKVRGQKSIWIGWLWWLCAFYFGGDSHGLNSK